jgi:hypothetical protein
LTPTPRSSPPQNGHRYNSPALTIVSGTVPHDINIRHQQPQPVLNSGISYVIAIEDFPVPQAGAAALFFVTDLS